MKYLYAVLLLLIITVQSFTQEIHILRGKVIDGETEEPLIGAMIFNPEDITINCTTDTNGQFELELADPVEYIIVNYNCSLMDFWIVADWNNEMLIEYGTKKAFRKSKRLERKVKKMKKKQ